MKGTLDFTWITKVPEGKRRVLAKLWAKFQRMKPEGKRRVMVRRKMAAELLGVSNQWLGQLIKVGRVESCRIGGARFVVGSSLEAFAKTRRWQRRRAPVRAWTVEEEELLGTMRDTELGAKLGRTVTVVRYRRRALGIGSVRGSRPWTADEDKLLGTMADAKVAAKLGRTVPRVRYRRWVLGRAGKKQGREPWTAEEDRVLGTAPDLLVAQKLGRTFSEVIKRRCKLAVDCYRWRQRVARLNGERVAGGAKSRGQARGVAANMRRRWGWA